MKIDNTTILTVSAVSFLLFVTAEIIGALASGSLSLLGDAGAMSVDVFTVIESNYSFSLIYSSVFL
jgi:Co/Zn/Cd efflux system component